jgi:hypothetical protein
MVVKYLVSTSPDAIGKIGNSKQDLISLAVVNGGWRPKLKVNGNSAVHASWYQDNWRHLR